MNKRQTLFLFVQHQLTSITSGTSKYNPAQSQSPSKPMKSTVHDINCFTWWLHVQPNIESIYHCQSSSKGSCPQYNVCSLIKVIFSDFYWQLFMFPCLRHLESSPLSYVKCISQQNLNNVWRKPAPRLDIIPFKVCSIAILKTAPGKQAQQWHQNIF